MAVPRHLLVHLATEAIRTLVLEQRVLDVPGSFFAELPWASEPAAAFVSLKLAGALRGCIGTTESSRPSLAEEVIQSAIGAGINDYIVKPVRRDVLKEKVERILRSGNHSR